MLFKFICSSAAFYSNDGNDINSLSIADFVFVDKIFAVEEHCLLWFHVHDTLANKIQP